MTERQIKLVENYVRKQVRKSLAESEFKGIDNKINSISQDLAELQKLVDAGQNKRDINKINENLIHVQQLVQLCLN